MITLAAMNDVAVDRSCELMYLKVHQGVRRHVVPTAQSSLRGGCGALP